ncbi:MAG TPA: arylsulfatase [Rhodopirellula baltica]|uniref:Arylsulfatase (A or B) n=1 Tax=Rhodopirellula baltica (strain DSM 10527 / NCIMB 13988 / SH1) TaxID=243090 RepID=Q7UYW2_RHOBA|nr:sulfatase [Rhodopirellula baltica]CAD71529.1 arylsulfatase (A or B) [Rhodopirellula baltica SH 1]HBE63414.1 arylsulfatase [Rhodopirellula baltica]
MSNPSFFAKAVAAFCCLVASDSHFAVADAENRPNILFILADDLAWSDLGCYGHPWHDTPHLDRLASEGARFTQAYSPAPICSASRASILTGKTPARLQFEFVTKNEPGRQKIDFPTPMSAPPLTLNLPLEEQTIAECLKDEGYQTAFFGKWHVSSHHERYLGWSPTHGPAKQGFEFAEEDYGAHPYDWKRSPVATIKEPGRFAPDSMVQRVGAFLRQDHDRPYFAMASSFYVHTPVRTPCQWLREKYDARVPATSKKRNNRIEYAAFLETFDHHVGQILNSLEASGRADRTIVILNSDNGGHPEYTANAPLRGSKWNLYEGGIRVPMIVRWPGVVQPKTEIDRPVIGYDLLPTMVALAGGNPPKCDGESFAGSLRGDSPPTNEQHSLIWHFPYYHPENGFAKAPDSIGIDDFATSRTRPQSAIRRGQFKLLQFAEDNRVELYDLSNDIGELHDLSTQQADLASELQQELRQTLTRQNARFPMAK